MSDDVGGLDRVAANERRFIGFVKSHRLEWPVELECECTGAVCDRRIQLTAAAYRPLHSSAAWFAIYPSDLHVDRQLDRVIDRQPRYWVVERRASAEALELLGSRTRATELKAPTGVDGGTGESA